MQHFLMQNLFFRCKLELLIAIIKQQQLPTVLWSKQQQQQQKIAIVCFCKVYSIRMFLLLYIEATSKCEKRFNFSIQRRSGNKSIRGRTWRLRNEKKRRGAWCELRGRIDLKLKFGCENFFLYREKFFKLFLIFFLI